MSVLLSLLVGLEAASGIWLPTEAAQPVGRYLSCLYDPVERVLTSGQPKEKSARSEIVSRELARCSQTRTAVAIQIDQRMGALPAWKNSSARKTHIETALGAMDRQYRFMVVERERFIEMSHAYEKCVEEKGLDKC